MEGAAEGNHLAAAVLEGYGAEVTALEERLAVIQHKGTIREDIVGDVGLLKAEGLFVGLQAEEDAHGHGAVFRGQVGQRTAFVAAGAVEAIGGLDVGGIREVPHLLCAGDLLHLDIVIVGIRVAHTQLAIVITIAAPEHATILNVKAVVVANHLAAALNRGGALHAASVIVVQGLPLLGGEVLAVAVISHDGADTVGDQLWRVAEAISCGVQLAALGQKHGISDTGNHIHDLLGDIHLHNLIAIGGSAITQLAIPVAAPRPDGAVLLQSVVAAITAIYTALCVIIRRDLLHTGHGLAVVKVVDRHSAVHIVILQRAVGEDVDAGFVVAVYHKVVHVGEVQLLGRHIALAPAPEGTVTETGVIRTILIQILYILHLCGRRRIGDADHQLGGQIGAHKGGTKGGSTVLVLDELAVRTHFANVRVGGLPCDVPLGGGGRSKGQLQVVVRLLHGGDVDALLKRDALRRLHHGDGDGRGEVLAHGGAGGDNGGAHGHGVYGAVDIHGGHILIGTLVDHAGAGGILRGEHGRQLFGAAHGQAESVLVEGQALQRHTVGHMDGHVPVHGAVGIADAHHGAAGGHGGDEAGIADGDHVLIQGGVFQVGHQRRFHGGHFRQQLLCHAGVHGDLGLGQGDVGDGGVGVFQQEIVVVRTAIAFVELVVAGSIPVISSAIGIGPLTLGNIRPKGHIRRVTVQPAQCTGFILPQATEISVAVAINLLYIGGTGIDCMLFQIRL